MQAHSALRPPHMLSTQPHVYAVSSERISNTRGDQMDESTDNRESYLDPSFSQFVVTWEMMDASPSTPNMTAEQAMEADAARALEELAVAGSWHTMPEPHATETYSPQDRRSPNLHPHPFGPPPAFPAYPSLTPLSSTHSTDQNLDGQGSEMEGEDDKDPQNIAPNGDLNPPAYFDDGTGHALPIRRFVAYNPRKRVTGAPVPVPHLTKPSRGRRVPTAAPTGSEEDSEPAVPDRGVSPPSRSTTASPYGTRSGTSKSTKTPGTSKLSPSDFAPKIPASMRSYICQVDGCGKAFRRGEHLKRHIRSLHTHEKRE